MSNWEKYLQLKYQRVNMLNKGHIKLEKNFTSTIK